MSEVVIKCTECGNETTEGEQFCQSCHTYLGEGWWGERRDASKEAALADEEYTEAGGEAPVVVAPTTSTAAVTTEAAPAVLGAPTTPATVVAGEPSTAAPANGGAPRADVVAPQPPGKEDVGRPPRALGQAWRRAAGDVICTNCRNQNPRGAKFCRTCGVVLVGTPPVTVTRWQRLRRHPAFLEAGQRPGWTQVVVEGPRRIPRRIAIIAAVVVVLAALAAGAAWLWATKVGHFGHRVAHDVRVDVYPYYTPVRPVSVKWHPAAKLHPGTKAFDRDLTTYWKSPKRLKENPAAGVGGSLVARMQAPGVDLDRVGIFAGDPVGKQLVPSQLRVGFFKWDYGAPKRNRNPRYPGKYRARPHAQGVFVTRGRNGKLVKTTNDPHKARTRTRKGWVLVDSTGIRLANKPGFQFFPLAEQGVGLVVITVKGVYDVTSPGTAALTEVEFFRKH
jgi:hypothetical protein